MAKVRVVETAQRRPGRCAVSSETTGPFIDTGQDIPRYGRVYLSVRWTKQRLHDAGLLNEKDETDLELGELQNRVIELEEVDGKYAELLDALASLVPTPEPEVQEVEVRVPRDPSDEEIESWIERKGGNHPVVRGARTVEKGSTEEWYSLYGEDSAVTPQEVADEVHQEPIHPDEPAAAFNIHDQEIVLDTVLDQNVKDVLTFSEDKGEGFHAALARREVFVAEREGRKARKGVLAPLGFWNEDEDEPVVPGDAQQGGGETPTGQEGRVPDELTEDPTEETDESGFSIGDDEDEIEDEDFEDGEDE